MILKTSLTVLAAIFLMGVELPDAYGRSALDRSAEREAARAQSKRREEQRVTNFNNQIKARQQQFREANGTLQTLANASIAACDRASFRAAKSRFKKIYARAEGWWQDRSNFFDKQSRKYKKKLSETHEKIESLSKENSDALSFDRRVGISALREVQWRNAMDLEYRIAALKKLDEAAWSYDHFIGENTHPLRYQLKYPEDCTKETLSHKPKDTGNVPKDEGKHAALKDKVIRKEDIEKNKDKPDETRKELREDRRRPPKPKAEEDRIVEADEGGMLVGKSLKLSDLDGCGTFLRINWDEIMGFVSTPCPGLTGGRVATQGDYLTYCNSIKRTRMHCGPPGPGTEKRIEKSGIQGMPFNVFCLSLHFNILGKGDYNSRFAQGNLRPVFKYDNGSRKLECYYVSKEQAKSLYQQYKNIGKDPSPAKPVARAEPKNDCKPGGGLVSAMNCVTKRIEGAGGSGAKTPDSAGSTDANTGTTTTSVKNPDGSRTVTKTDKDGNVLSKERVGKAPASASSIDKKTGITTKSVRNPDGTRTVTKTDRDGNVLSREKVGKSPDSASSTKLNTGEKITSVANPDGSRTVTKTDKDGNVLSREKVR